LENLWWVMQQSDDPKRLASVVTLYLDESATDDNAPLAVVGGLLLNKSRFEAFDRAFPEVLKRHRVPGPLHMKDFRRPDGRLADITNDTRRLLFTDVVQLINECKLYSLAATLSTASYKKHFEARFRKEGMGLYGACFIICAEINHQLAKHNGYDERIPILMDSGNPYADHVRGAHAELLEERWKEMRVGSLTLDDDKLWTPLQAADVIAWASSVREQTGTFNNGYEPLMDLFDEAHEQHQYPEGALETLAANIQERRDKGTFPL
jgi:hypothetical protein